MCKYKKNKRKGNAKTGSAVDRRLFVIDIENYCGKQAISQRDVMSARQSIYDSFHPTNEDLIVIGTSYSENCLNAGLAWRGARAVWSKGKDGADLALIEALGTYRLDSFKELVLVTGDHIFADKVRQVRADGVRVTVVSCRKSLSRKLAASATNIHIARERTPRKTAAGKTAGKAAA
jgi:hypothetical protein